MCVYVCVHMYFRLTAGEGVKVLVALLMECYQMLTEGQGPEYICVCV